ncbi:Na/Pi symporter [Aliiroseovarius subalbicans]|uniref:Na/Pi cotransporter family protein n=1 Tax=Aliiroseovarius subalbicans TaxID=2925840 RepID=UPI001F5AB9BB|nr:Na/Pi symporter [Aliiroseovarius subalbicans]MCI2400863.1 Na/Pi symporter [Aliiroseovarius subalbicans]
MKRLLLPVILGFLVFGFWISPDFQEIAAGVAIFLFGMLMLEDGFKLFSGGFLERLLERATGSTLKSLSFGVLTTTIMQSSSLVSVITISFLSAGLISLAAGVGIIFGANIGTTTGAWLVAGFGLKVKISAYALPMLAVAIVLVFQRSKYLRGIGFVLAGLGFLFLGIHYMKEGFEAFKDQFDLTRFAMTGLAGLVVYTLVGAAATVVMQSSHATLVLIITALAAGQISYENALALAIGANIGTTITAILGAMTANYQGRRLALAHLIFNVITAGVALVLISPIRDAVDGVSAFVGIAEDDYALKLAVFHTIFNTMGVAIMLPVMKRLLAFLERTIKEDTPDISQPIYISESIEGFPAAIELALFKEVGHLHDNAIEVIAHGLNLHRHELYEAEDIEAYVASAKRPFEMDIDEAYETRIKVLYSAIVEFITRVSSGRMPEETVNRIHKLREAAERMVGAVKEVKHMRSNATLYTSSDQGTVTEAYNTLRTELARIMVEYHKMAETEPGDRSSLWLEEERKRVKRDKRATSDLVETLIRSGGLSAHAGTSFSNDAGYAYRAMKDMLEAARVYFAEVEGPMKEVERLLAMDEDELEDDAPDSMAQELS